jgi:hypothetical protein
MGGGPNNEPFVSRLLAKDGALTVLGTIFVGAWAATCGAMQMLTPAFVKRGLVARALRRRKNIVESTVTRDGLPNQRPPTLQELGTGRVIGRTIKSWNGRYGSYGMGGPGFFGVELAAAAQGPNEHLILTLWGACGWLLLDGRWVEAHPGLYEDQRPLFSVPEHLDDVTPRLVGGTIVRFDLEDSSCRVEVRNGDLLHVLELPRDTARLPVLMGTGEHPRWHDDEKVADAWVICDGDIYC